jgi:hypothetical protein
MTVACAAGPAGTLLSLAESRTLRYEVVVTPSTLDSFPYDKVSGSIEKTVSSAPLPIFSDEAVSFLSALSSEIMKDKSNRALPDLISFGYWCRRANIERMSGRYDKSRPMTGRGIALHIPPANVPLNFAYSLAAGLLAGNSNIIRLSSTKSLEVDRCLGMIDLVLEQPDHARIRNMICAVRYPHDDEVTQMLSRIADVRVIWGGDRTVERIRAIPAKPRTVDVAFADRVSVSILHAASVESLSENEMIALAERFYADAFTFGQNACSSPRLVIWCGEPQCIEATEKRFWSALDAVVLRRGELEPIHVMNRLVELCENIVVSSQISGVDRTWASVVRIGLNDDNDWQSLSGLRFGTFSSISIEKIEQIPNLLDDKVQTVGHAGFDKSHLDELASIIIPMGVDRLVPLGSALEFDLVWDGYDLIGTLARTVSVSGRR